MLDRCGFTGTDRAKCCMRCPAERAYYLIEDDGPSVGLRAGAGPGDDHLLRLDVVERSRPPGDAQTDILGDGADPGEAAHVVAGITRADQRLENRPIGEGRDRGAVARRLLGETVRRADAARARHHLHRHRRFAGNMAPDVASDQPRVKIDAAARGAGHIDGHRPVDGVLRFARLCRTKHERGSARRKPPTQRPRGEGERTACAAITRRERQTACAATRRGHQAGIGTSPTSFGTL